MFEGIKIPEPYDESRRPKGNNADEWLIFLTAHVDSLPYLAVQIAEAIDAAAITRKEIDAGIKALEMFGHKDAAAIARRDAMGNSVTIARGDDWEGLYINGRLKMEGHSLDLVDVLEKVQKLDNFAVKRVDVDLEWLHDRGDLPQDESQLQIA